MTFRCGSVYDKTRVKSLFVEGLHDHIRSTVQTWCQHVWTVDFQWRSHNKAAFQPLQTNEMAAVDLRRGSKVPGSNSGFTNGGNASRAPQRIWSTVVTI